MHGLMVRQSCLVIALLCCAILFSECAAAQTAVTATPAPVAPSSSPGTGAIPGPANSAAQQKPPAPSPPAGAALVSLENQCLHPDTSDVATSGRSKLLVTLADGRIWQPRDGKIRFIVTARDGASPSSIGKLALRVCFGWSPKYCGSEKQCPTNKGQNRAAVETAETYYLSSNLVPIERDATAVTYETALPAGLWRSQNPKPPDFLHVLGDMYHRIMDEPSYVYDGMGLVPSVDMRVVGRSIDATALANDDNALDTTLSVGLSFRLVAFMIALLAVAAVWLFLYLCASSRNVPGGVLLRIIANKNGYASLSQLQMVLWTLVIGAGAIYVMSLSGALIAIPPQALALLGVSGFSGLLAAIKYANDEKNPPKPAAAPAKPAAETAAPSAPGPVRELEVLSAGATDLFLVWLAPPGGLPTDSYRISWKEHSAAEFSSATPKDTYFHISGLKPSTSYTVKVVALTDKGAAGSETIIEDVTPALNSSTKSAPVVKKVTIELPNNDNTVLLKWEAENNPSTYVVQYRRAGVSGWNTWPNMIDASTLDPILGTKYEMSGLETSTPYEFCIFGVRDGIQGNPSSAVAIKTGKHAPRWSDLVVWDGTGEIDITRVQMLVFTAIAAVFVAIKIADESVIPQISDSVVVLMGLTNTVYLGGKFTGARK